MKNMKSVFLIMVLMLATAAMPAFGKQSFDI